MIARIAIRTPRPLWIRYASSTSPGAPPMLLKIRNDLKNAMRAKDTVRLSVLRALLSSTLNASKTSNPITTDMQMLKLVRNTIDTSKASAQTFAENKREDLAEKEQEQVRVLEEYAGTVEVLGDEEIRSVVRGVVGEAPVGEGLKLGDLMKKVLEGFGDRPVEKGEVVRVVREVMAEKGAS